MSRKARVGLDQLWQAFDAARFGADRTLNLRATLPTADEAARRAEIWLRQKQVERAPEVLVVTGRGNNSEAGFSVVREAVIRTLHDLRRRNVVKEWEEHTAGSFVVRPASMTSLVEAPRREKAVPPKPASPPSLDALDDSTRRLLRDLAERVLEGLGVHTKEPFLEGEMLKQFGRLARTVPPHLDGAAREGYLREAIRRTLDEYE